MHTITDAHIAAYLAHLAREERAAATIEKYARSLRAFACWLGGQPATQEAAIAYKQRLAAMHAPASVNAALAALGGFFGFTCREIRIKPLKIQRQTYRDREKELSRAEYGRLLRAAAHDERLCLLLQTICATGIRVGELRYITVEVARAGRGMITNKGKTRVVFLPKKLQIALLRYAKERGVLSGCIFVTKGGKPLDRSNIWRDMKRLCAAANVAPTKVFPHNLRHLFARVFYGAEKDIVKLADILGHASVTTTRIYLMESGEAHRRRIDRLGLVV
jgi:site-specific recombinase XerD